MPFKNVGRSTLRPLRRIGISALVLLVLSLAAAPEAEASYAQRRADVGALDLDIKPKKAEIYIDGRYIGRIDEFDGYPDFLWLKEGTYQLACYKEGYRTVSREYAVYAGELINVRFRLERGEAVRPLTGGHTLP